jgi:hypothetical protein
MLKQINTFLGILYAATDLANAFLAKLVYKAYQKQFAFSQVRPAIYLHCPISGVLTLLALDFFFFFALLRVELSILVLLGRHCTTGAMLPILFVLVILR